MIMLMSSHLDVTVGPHSLNSRHEIVFSSSPPSEGMLSGHPAGCPRSLSGQACWGFVGWGVSQRGAAAGWLQAPPDGGMRIQHCVGSATD